MKIEIKAKHFKNSTFINNFDCPLCRAVKEATGASVVGVDTGRVYIGPDGEEEYGIINGFEDCYNCAHYNNDFIIAVSRDFDEWVIRTVELHEPVLEF